MLSARELALDKNPSATGWVNQRLVYTHGIGRRDGAGQRGHDAGPAGLVISNLPPVSTGGAAEIDRAADLLRRAAVAYVIVGAEQDEFDYPRGSSDNDVRPNRWTGTTGITLDTTLTRLLFALRFRDFDLLISDQITDESQLLMNRSIGERLPARSRRSCGTTRIRTWSSTAAATLKYIQDAFTIERPVPERPGVQPAELGPSTGLGGDASTTSGTASRSSWTPTTAR